MADTLMCDRAEAAALLPSQPYQAVAYHYGMLLGVDDFNTDQASHRGKVRLHNAWLHGFGVVWGLGVSLDLPRGELRVEAGLGIDGAGRELPNDGPQCVSVGAWFTDHREDAGFSYEETDDGVSFDCQVVIRHRACLARPVPAMLDTCAGATSDTAFSRVLETVEILIRPGIQPRPIPRGRLLRVLVGLEAAAVDDDGAVLADDQQALDGAAEIAAATPADRLATAAAVYHRISVLETLAAKPGTDADEIEVGLYPDGAPEELVLATVTGLALTGPGPDAAAPRWALAGGDVDPLVRAVLLPTSALQDMAAGAHPSGAAPAAPAVEAGPRIDANSVTRAGATITLKVDRPLIAETVTPAAFAASAFDTGWADVAVTAASLDGTGQEITLTLASDPAGLLRLRAMGAGGAPLLGDNKLPLFGEASDRPATPTDALRGADFVWHG